MRPVTFAILLICLTGISPVTHAQEATASGALNTQASWSALQNMLTATNGNVSLLRIDVNAMKVCGAQKKIWTGTACVAPTVTTPGIDTSVYDKLVACADKGQFYDKSANACVNATGIARWIERSSASSPSTSSEPYARESVIKELKKKGATRECTASERAGRQCYVTTGTKCYLPPKCSTRTVGSQDQSTRTECSSSSISCN